MLILSFGWLIAAGILIARALRQRTVFREIEKPPACFDPAGAHTAARKGQQAVVEPEQVRQAGPALGIECNRSHGKSDGRDH